MALAIASDDDASLVTVGSVFHSSFASMSSI